MSDSTPTRASLRSFENGCHGIYPPLLKDRFIDFDWAGRYDRTVTDEEHSRHEIPTQEGTYPFARHPWALSRSIDWALPVEKLKLTWRMFRGFRPDKYRQCDVDFRISIWLLYLMNMEYCLHYRKRSHI